MQCRHTHSLSAGVACLAALLLAVCTAAGVSAQPAAADDGPDEAKPLGDFENPVRCDGPSAERYYLARLVDPDGQEINFSREGSFGVGPYGNILDGYKVVVGERTIRVFIDMYHPGYTEDSAIDGFDIRCRHAWDLVTREDGLRYAVGEDQPFDGEFTRAHSETGTTLATLTLEDGLIQGPVMHYDAEGTLRSIVPFRDSKEHGLARYYDEQGWKMAEIHYQDGQRHGPSTWFTMDIHVETEAHYEQGQPAGEWRSYYPGGELRRVGSYQDGQRHGEWIEYDREGSVIKTETYEAGERIEVPEEE